MIQQPDFLIAIEMSTEQSAQTPRDGSKPTAAAALNDKLDALTAGMAQMMLMAKTNSTLVEQVNSLKADNANMSSKIDAIYDRVTSKANKSGGKSAESAAGFDPNAAKAPTPTTKHQFWILHIAENDIPGQLIGLSGSKKSLGLFNRFKKDYPDLFAACHAKYLENVHASDKLAKKYTSLNDDARNEDFMKRILKCDKENFPRQDDIKKFIETVYTPEYKTYQEEWKATHGTSKPTPKKSAATPAVAVTNSATVDSLLDDAE
jgi:hypothetical protein